MKTDTTTYRQRQILLVVAGIVVFSEPFLGIMRSEAMVLGLPVTMVAIFGLWLAVIVGIAWIMQSDPGPNPPVSAPTPDVSPELGAESVSGSDALANSDGSSVSSHRPR